MEKQTIPARLKYWSSIFPHKNAFVFEHPQQESHKLSFNEVAVLSGKFARRLQNLGIKKGDIACSALPNCPERVICDFGVMAAGCVTVPGATVMADGSDVIHTLFSSKSKFIIVNPDTEVGVWKILKPLVVLEEGTKARSQHFPDLQGVIFIKPGGDFLTSLQHENDPEDVDIQPFDLATLMTTAGSTGFSKLVATTHRRLFSFSRNYASMHNIDGTKSVYRDRPLGWSGGFPFFCVEGPATQYLLDERLPPPVDSQAFIWNLICREKIDSMFCTPPFLLNLLARDDISTDWVMETIVTAGQCIKTNITPAIGRLCRTLSVAYGSTEAGICTHQAYTSAEDVRDYNVGTYVSGAEVKIVDDNFQPLPDGEMGQLIIKSDGCFTEYFNNPDATRKAFLVDGWFCMDDTGYRDASGRFFVLGRKSDLIMKGSTKVYPGWLEAQMMASPLVNDVIIVPVPDDVFVNEICACVIPSSESVCEDDLRKFCESLFQESSLTTTVVPKYYRIMTSFPCNSFGKTDRKALKNTTKQMQLQNEL